MPTTRSSVSGRRLHPVAAPARPLALMLMAAGAIFMSADPDLWGHVRFGLDILESGRLVSAADRYSFTADKPFVYHEWLGGTLMGLAYRVAGPVGLQAYKACLAIAFFTFLWACLRRVTFGWRWTGLALAALGMLPMLATLRPQIWSAFGLVIVTQVLLSGKRPALFIFPPLFALWANLHGGWIVGGGIVAIFAACWLLQRDSRGGLLLAIGAVSFLATLATPYGLGLWQFLFETVRLSRSDVTEWQPLWRAGWDSLAIWLAAVAVVVATVRRQRLPVPVLVTTVVLAVGAALVDRLSPLFVAAVVSMLARVWPVEESAPAADRARTTVDVIAVVATVAALIIMRGPQPCISLRESYAPDTVAAESLRGRSGRVATFFDWGEYALWHFGPALQVSLDGRRETVYREPTFRAQSQIVEGTALGLQTLERMQPEYVWLPNWSPTRTWLESHGYAVQVVTDRSFVAARLEQAPLRPWSGMSSGCFPGP